MYKIIFLFFALTISCSIFSQTAYETKINELGIGPYEFVWDNDANAYDYSNFEFASGNFGSVPPLNEVNSRYRYGYLYPNNPAYESNSIQPFGTNKASGFEILIRKLKNNLVLHAYPNSVGGVFQTPPSGLYGQDFDVYIYNQAGELISYFSTNGLDQNGNPWSSSASGHYYYNEVYLDNSVSLPSRGSQTMYSKRWGASYETQSPGDIIYMVFDFNSDFWMYDLYNGNVNLAGYYASGTSNNTVYTSANGIPQGFVIETTVSDNSFLPYNKYNPWNDEIWGIAQTDNQLRIKDSSNNIIVQDISTGESDYDLPVADWGFSSTLSVNIAESSDEEVFIETKINGDANYSTDQKSIIYTSNQFGIDLFSGNNEITPNNEGQIVINRKAGQSNLTYDEVNRFSFDRSSSQSTLSGMQFQNGDGDKFWTGTNLAITETDVIIPTTTDLDWILPASRENLPLKVSSRSISENWHGDLRETASDPSINGYVKQTYIGINSIYALDTGNFTPIDNAITGLGESVGDVSVTWSYKDGLSNHTTTQPISFKVHGIRAWIDGLENTNSFFSYYSNNPNAIYPERPWGVIKLSSQTGDNPVDYSNFADPIAVENTFSYVAVEATPYIDFRENMYATHLKLSERNGAFRQMRYDGINLYPSTAQEIVDFPYESWKYNQNSSPFSFYWQRGCSPA